MVMYDFEWYLNVYFIAKLLVIYPYSPESVIAESVVCHSVYYVYASLCQIQSHTYIYVCILTYIYMYICVHMFILIVPTPDIQISVFGYETLGNETLRNVTIGDPLTLDCTVTAVRGISSSVDIIIGWSTRSRILRRVNNVMGVVKDDSMIYTDSLEIPSLSAIDNGKDYLCTVLFNSSQVLAFNIDIFTLIFPGEYTYHI